MNITNRPLSWFVERIVKGPPLTFSRWGDGEWRSIFGQIDKQNCDAHPYTQALCDRLRVVLRARPEYVLGMQGLALKHFQGAIEDWLDVDTLGLLDWVDADVFHDASRKKRLGPLVEAVRDVPTLLIGPPFLSSLQEALLFRDHVSVPRFNAFADLDRILIDATHAIDRLPGGGLIAVSAGMPAKALIHDLHPIAVRHNCSLIDFGSLWDIYAGVRSRKYMHGMDKGPAALLNIDIEK